MDSEGVWALKIALVFRKKQFGGGRMRGSVRGLVRGLRSRLLRAGYVRLREKDLSAHLLPTYLDYVLRKYAIDCVVDVGANGGQFAHMLRSRLNYRGPVVSFEPGPEAFDRLQATLAHEKNIDLHRCAVGSADTEMELNIMEMDVLNSFFTPHQAEVEITPNRVTRTEMVPVFRLDSLAARIGMLQGARRILLKTDTQGFDLEVIEGATGLLDKTVGILIEMPFSRIYEVAPTYHEVISALRNKGFFLGAIAPSGVIKDRIVDVDALFLNEQFAC